MSDSTLLLIDGTAVAYRAFYAIADLSTREGRPTNALFGFIRMLQQLEQTWKPTHWAAVFDGGLPVARLNLLPDYKAQRKPMPEPLSEQLPLIADYLALRKAPVVRMEGEEADDVLATLVRTALNRPGDVLMATSDKDMFQLVSERVGIVSPSKTGQRMGPDDVSAKTGVPPALVVDWLALTGDTVDNIPGVPGVGPKTAAKLLVEFGSVNKLLECPERIEPARIRGLLVEHADRVRRNLELTRLRSDLDGLPEWEDLQWTPPDAGQLNPFFQKMELHSFLVEDAAAPTEKPVRAPAAEQQELFDFGLSGGPGDA